MAGAAAEHAVWLVLQRSAQLLRRGLGRLLDAVWRAGPVAAAGSPRDCPFGHARCDDGSQPFWPQCREPYRPSRDDVWPCVCWQRQLGTDRLVDRLDPRAGQQMAAFHAKG